MLKVHAATEVWLAVC